MKKLKLVLWVLILGVLTLLLGCDDGDDDDNDLTVANLQGTYDLDVSRSMLGGFTEANIDVISGMLEVDATAVTFNITGVSTLSFVIADANTLTLTDADGDMQNVQATLTGNGATLTIVVPNSGNMVVFNRLDAGTGNDLTIANLQGTYSLNVAASAPLDLIDDDFRVTSAVLEITDTTLTLTQTGTFEGTYMITGEDTVTVTEADGDVLEFTASLSNDSMNLRFVDQAGNLYQLNKR